MEDLKVDILNSYIEYYKNQIDDVNLLDGINENDVTSTNMQLELLYEETLKYKKNDNNFIDIHMDFTKKYIILKNNEPFCSSESLLSALIEINKLKNEDSSLIYKVKNKN